MLDFNFKKNMPKNYKIYFIAVILMRETRQEQDELSITSIAD